jgi:hypothetical protein
LQSGCAGATYSASTSTVATSEGRNGGTFGQSSFDDHTDVAGLSVDRLTMSATLASTLSPVPSSVRASLVDPN